jgi:hypothetical protein
MLALVRGRAATALIGALAGGAVGLLLLVTTHPTSAYLNDAYRQGASFGFVLRYVALGLVAAVLVRALRGAGGRGRVLAGVALAVVLGLAIVPPALDTQTESEKRRAAAAAIDDPDERARAEARAGALDGCVEGARRQAEEAGLSLDAEAYCECFIDAITAPPGDNLEELRAANAALQSPNPPRRLQRLTERCAKRAGL